MLSEHLFCRISLFCSQISVICCLRVGGTQRGQCRRRLGQQNVSAPTPAASERNGGASSPDRRCKTSFPSPNVLQSCVNKHVWKPRGLCASISPGTPLSPSGGTFVPRLPSPAFPGQAWVGPSAHKHKAPAARGHTGTSRGCARVFHGKTQKPA